jgi:FkbM family methyltransferase
MAVRMGRMVVKIALKVGIAIQRISEYIKIFGIVRGLSKAAEHLVKSRGLVSRNLFCTKTPDGDDVWLRPKSSDLATYREVFVNGEYDLRKFDIFKVIEERYESLLANGSRPLIVDAGANIGLASVFLARLFPKAEFILVEASPENIEVARLNVSRILETRLLNKALWHQRGILHLVTSPNYSTYSVTDRNDPELGLSEIESISMNEIVESRRGDLFIVKMDIEGSEASVFRLHNEWLDAGPIVLVEPHDQEIPGNNSLRGLFELKKYQAADVIMNGATMILVPRSMPIAN